MYSKYLGDFFSNNIHNTHKNRYFFHSDFPTFPQYCTTFLVYSVHAHVDSSFFFFFITCADVLIPLQRAHYTRDCNSFVYARINPLVIFYFSEKIITITFEKFHAKINFNEFSGLKKLPESNIIIFAFF